MISIFHLVVNLLLLGYESDEQVGLNSVSKLSLAVEHARTGQEIMWMELELILIMDNLDLSVGLARRILER